jgi:hypothetical protein
MVPLKDIEEYVKTFKGLPIRCKFLISFGILLFIIVFIFCAKKGFLDATWQERFTMIFCPTKEHDNDRPKTDKEDSITYQGSVLDDDTRKGIMGAEIAFTGYANEVPSCQTNGTGFFHIQLPREYQNAKIKITHKNYEPKEDYRKLTEDFIKQLDVFYLIPKKKRPGVETKEQKQEEKEKPITIEEEIVVIEPTIIYGEWKTGVDTIQDNALEQAKKLAKNDLLSKYSDDNEKQTVDKYATGERGTVQKPNGEWIIKYRYYFEEKHLKK